MRKVGLGLVALVLAAVVSSAPASADEAKAPVSASMILTILSRPIEPEAASLDRRLRDDPPARATEPEGEVLADGSVRYGRMTVTVKNPCPPGTAHYEPPSLPGRRVRK